MFLLPLDEVFLFGKALPLGELARERLRGQAQCDRASLQRYTGSLSKPCYRHAYVSLAASLPSQSHFVRQLPQRESLWRVGQASTGRAKHDVSETVVLRCLDSQQIDKIDLSRSICPLWQGPPFCVISDLQRSAQSFPACQWLSLWESCLRSRLRGLLLL